MDRDIVDIFCDLVRIPSPSGRELAVAQYIQNYLGQSRISFYVDDVGKLNQSNTGNVIVKLGTGVPQVLFVAHMDTVETGDEQINPIIKEGTIMSDGSTILGSDDKAGVAALLSAIAELSSEKDVPSVLCIFSTREEKGLLGVNYLDVEREIPFVFDVDGSKAVGSFINKTLGFTCFELIVSGKEAHATINPELGLNSIKAAGLVISNLDLSKWPDGSMLNIGTIIGGTAPNVIPGRSKLVGEVRGFSSSDMDKRLDTVRAEAEKACRITGCTYELVKIGGVLPFYVEEGKNKIIELAKSACLAMGLEFRPITLSATIQGNVLAEKGYNVLGLCKGGKLPHSKSESIEVRELEQTKRLIIEIVRCIYLKNRNVI